MPRVPVASAAQVVADAAEPFEHIDDASLSGLLDRVSHYFEASLPNQFDEWIWFDGSRAVEPLGGTARVPAIREGHPFAPLDV